MSSRIDCISSASAAAYMSDAPIAPIAAPPRPRRTSFQAICLDAGSDSSYFRAVRNTLRTWKTVLGDRTGLSRVQAQSGDPLKIQQRDEDLALDRGYRELTDYFRAAIDKIENGQNDSEESVVRCVMLVDDQRNIQALSIASLKSNQLYTRIVISAPWNLKMHAPVDSDHESLRVQRAGTTMILALYQIAQQNNLLELRLKPLDVSYLFYKEVIEMREDDSTGEFFYPVGTDSIPLKLQPQCADLNFL